MARRDLGWQCVKNAEIKPDERVKNADSKMLMFTYFPLIFSPYSLWETALYL